MKNITTIVLLTLQIFCLLYAENLIQTKSKEIFETDKVLIRKSSGFLEKEKCIIFLTVSDAENYENDIVEKSRKVYSYNTYDDFVKEIFVPNGHNRNSLKVPVHMIVKGDTLFFLDMKSSRISAMKHIAGKLECQYSFDMESKTRSTVFNIIDSKMYTSKSAGGTELSKSLSIYSINKDTLYKDSRILTDERHFIDYAKYRDQLDSRVNKFLKKRADKGSSKINLDATEAIISENIYFNVFAFKYNDKIFALNGCGTDIIEIKNDTEQFFTKIDTMIALRKLEEQQMREHQLLPGHFDTYSQIQKIFCDESRNLIMLYLNRKQRMRDATGEQRDYLVLKYTNLDNDEVVLPINFVPVHYNEETGTFYGLKQEDGVLKYVEYKLEV